LSLVTIDHTDMTSPLYLVLNNENIDSNGTTYTASSLDVIPISSEPGEVPHTQLRIDNADATILAAIDGFTSPLDVTLALVMSTDLDTELMTQPLRLTKFTTDLQTIVGTLDGPDHANEPVPALVMNRRNCPGLFSVISAEPY
jgi:hypothetical protein